MDGLDLDIAFAMTKHFSNKISPMHNFIVPLQIGLVCYLLAWLDKNIVSTMFYLEWSQLFSFS